MHSVLLNVVCKDKLFNSRQNVMKARSLAHKGEIMFGVEQLFTTSLLTWNHWIAHR